MCVCAVTDLRSEYSDPTFYFKTPEKRAHEGTMVALRRPHCL